jgi:hypothetical protein
MALFLRQQGPRSELQERVAAELQEKLKTQQGIVQEADLGKAHDHDQQHHTRGAGVLIWSLILLLLIAVVWWASR